MVTPVWKASGECAETLNNKAQDPCIAQNKYNIHGGAI